ncbi:MAG: YIP1 family protein [Pseudooceanicola sp.]|nr:YIP1 family protein [Pseudooceanicola sp.]MCB1388205.1 YIP1 family protein [Paracoccaceae bacterium]
MNDLVALIRLALVDPVAGGRRILSLNPSMAVRWMLLGAAILVSVVLLYLVPLLMGDAGLLPSPFAFAATQGVMNLVVIALMTFVGRAFGGQGSFPDAVWLVGWMQVVTAVLLVAQIAALLVLPILNIPMGVASVALSIWVLVGFVCALHGFASRVAVLLGGFLTFIVVSFVLSMILLFLGIVPSEISNV